jgi:hypothetical protein
VMLALGPMGRIWTGYQHGIAGFNGWIYGGIPRWEFGSIAEQAQNPQAADWHSLLATGSGVAIVCLLAILQANVAWWRLSPVGFLLVGGWGINSLIWANAFVGWIVVNAIFRTGGLRLYQQVRPLFIGLFLGGTAATLFSSAVLLLTGVSAR